jgi:hypothetical protein
MTDSVLKIMEGLSEKEAKAFEKHLMPILRELRSEVISEYSQPFIKYLEMTQDLSGAQKFHVGQDLIYELKQVKNSTLKGLKTMSDLQNKQKVIFKGIQESLEKVAKARSDYRDSLEKIAKLSEDYNERYIDAKKKAARDLLSATQAEQIEYLYGAIDDLENATNELEKDTTFLSSPEFTNAVSLVNMIGEKMDIGLVQNLVDSLGTNQPALKAFKQVLDAKELSTFDIKRKIATNHFEGMRQSLNASVMRDDGNLNHVSNAVSKMASYYDAEFPQTVDEAGMAASVLKGMNTGEEVTQERIADFLKIDVEGKAEHASALPVKAE